MQNAIETIKALTYGTELEYTHISRERAAKAIQEKPKCRRDARSCEK